MANYELVALVEGTPQLRAPTAADVATTVGKLYPDLGIQLGGATSANLLNDYEEGVWVPVLSDGTNADATYARQLGGYIKVGNLVTYSLRLSISSLGSISGGLRITGLPFAAAANTDYSFSGCPGYTDGLAITAGNTISCRVAGGENFLRLGVMSLTTGVDAFTAAMMSADGDISFTGSYFV
jgi:hypothetical protein